MPRIQFTITASERAFFAEYARRRGLSLSQLAKMAIFSYEATHHFKGLELSNYPKSALIEARDAAFGE